MGLYTGPYLLPGPCDLHASFGIVTPTLGLCRAETRIGTVGQLVNAWNVVSDDNSFYTRFP